MHLRGSGVGAIAVVRDVSPSSKCTRACSETLLAVGLLLKSTVQLRLRSRSASTYPDHLPTSLHRHDVPGYLIPPAPRWEDGWKVMLSRPGCWGHALRRAARAQGRP